MHEADDASRLGEMPETMTSAEYRILLEKIRHLHSLMVQHDKLTELAITKSEASTNERFNKANEFREQQKDIISTFARQKETHDALEAITAKMDENSKSVTARYESNVIGTTEKLGVLSAHLIDKIVGVETNGRLARDAMKQAIDEKRDTLYTAIMLKFEDLQKAFNSKVDNGLKTIDDKIAANIRVEAARFAAIDAAMDTKINANAEVSNTGLQALNAWRTEQQGSLKVIYAVGGVFVTVAIAVLIYFITHMIKS